MTVNTSDITRAGRLDLIRIIEELKKENAGLRVQAKLDRVDELQTRMSEMVNNSLARRVRAFHLKFGHPVLFTPVVPTEKQMKFRLNLIGEEFFELLAACEIWPTMHVFDEEGKPIEIKGWEMVKNAIEYDFAGPSVVNFPEFVDALGDMEWVIEGTRAVCGVNGAPIMDEISRANMSKDPVYVAAKDEWHLKAGDPPAIVDGKPDPAAKPTKPEGWKPPDVAGELEKQGWKPMSPADYKQLMSGGWEPKP